MAKKPFTPIPPVAELPPAEEINVAELLDKYLTGEIDLICVLGPTASGKTRYAVQLARQINELLGDIATASAKPRNEVGAHPDRLLCISGLQSSKWYSFRCQR